MSSERKDFTKSWTIFNSLAFLVGFLSYGFLSHGFTGNHEGTLTTPQFLMHCIALIVASSSVLIGQKWILSDFKQVSAYRIIGGIFLFLLTFWVGWFLTGPPLDYVLGFLILATITWINRSLLNRKSIGQILLILFLFIVCPIIGNAILIALFQFSILSTDLPDLIIHVLLWLFIGGIGGMLASILSSQPVYKLINKEYSLEN